MGEGYSKSQQTTRLPQISTDTASAGKVAHDPLNTPIDVYASGLGDKGFKGRILGLLQQISTDTTRAGMNNLQPGDPILNPPGAAETNVLTWKNGKPSWLTGSSGGGASTADTFITAASDSDLTANTVIPGLRGSPDIKAGGTNDDDFEQNSSGVPSGWTTFGAATKTIENTTDFRSHYHLKCTSAGGGVDSLTGIYKAAPSVPFTMTAKIMCNRFDVNYPAAGIGISDASPPVKVAWIRQYGTSTGPFAHIRGDYFSNLTTASSNTTDTVISRDYIYLRMKVTSATSVDILISTNGQTWYTLASAWNPGSGAFASISSVCIINDPSGQDLDMTVDWIRFT